MENGVRTVPDLRAMTFYFYIQVSQADACFAARLSVMILPKQAYAQHISPLCPLGLYTQGPIATSKGYHLQG
jgi:hypothetical protein